MLRKVLFLICITRFVGSENMEPFIVGGKPAGMQNFGHSVFLTVETNRQSFICGASILNQNIILTAGHCFDNFGRNSLITIRAGSANKLSGSLRYATRLAVHSAYNAFAIQNDIALVYMNKPFIFTKNNNIKRVIIMSSPPARKIGYVAGWGLINERTPTDSDWLYRVKQALWSREECRKELRELPKGVLCGGVRNSGEYAAECRIPVTNMTDILYATTRDGNRVKSGDSGSALIIDGSVQIGLVSFKRPTISRSIVVYTDVAYFYNWITSTAQKLYCSQRS